MVSHEAEARPTATETLQSSWIIWISTENSCDCLIFYLQNKMGKGWKAEDARRVGVGGRGRKWAWQILWTFHNQTEEGEGLSLSIYKNHLVCCFRLQNQRSWLALLLLFVINFLDEFIDGTKLQYPPKQNHFPSLLHFHTPSLTARSIIPFIQVFTLDILQKSKNIELGRPNRVDYMRLPCLIEECQVLNSFESMDGLASTYEMTGHLVLRFSLKGVKQIRNIKNQALMANFLLRRRSSKLGGWLVVFSRRLITFLIRSSLSSSTNSSGYPAQTPLPASQAMIAFPFSSASSKPVGRGLALASWKLS